MGEWMDLWAFGWLRRPEKDAPGASDGRNVKICQAWEMPCGHMIWLVPGKTYFLRRTPAGLEIGDEEHVKQNG